MLKHKRPLNLRRYYLPTLTAGIFAVAIIFFAWPTVATLSAPANRPAKVKINWRIDEQYKDEIKNFRLWRQDNGGFFRWLTTLGPDKNGLLPSNYSYIEDQITQAGNYNYYVEVIKNDGQVASSVNSEAPLVGVNVICNPNCRASKIEDNNSTSNRGNSQSLGQRPSVTPIIPFDNIDKSGQKTIACFTERTKPWDDFLQNCETAADNLADYLDLSVEGRAETKVARNMDNGSSLCINGGEYNNCRWEESSFFSSVANTECNGQYYVCNLYYNAEGDNLVRSNILERNIAKSAGKPCAIADASKAGYCSLNGQCIACNSSQASNNVCQSGGTGFSTISFLIANAIIGAVDCPVKGCAGKGDVNQKNKDACKKGGSCTFSQFDKDCNITVSKGKCVGSKNNRICTIASETCPDELTACGDLCCNSNENCTSVWGVQPVCFSDNNKCKPPNILCKHGNSDGKLPKNNGVCCGPGYSCGVEPNKGYAYCNKANACDPETEIECKGGAWEKTLIPFVLVAKLNLSGLSLCCDKETQSCYQTGDKINGTKIAGHDGLPLCVTKDKVTECGADETKCSGLEGYGKIFTCCKNGQEYCAHPSPGGPVPYCREW